MTTEAQTLVGVIENIEIKDGKSDRGPWRLHKFKIRGPAGTRTYATFDKGWPTNLIGGDTYRFTFTEKQDGEFTNYNLTSATQVDPSEFGAQPASNGEFKQPYEPPTDDAKARDAIEPQPELKSPSRSYDQNRDIERRSRERQGALKAAVEIIQVVAKTDDSIPVIDIEQAILVMAETYFAWLREESKPNAPESPTEPVSEPQGTEKSFSGVAPYPGEPDDKPESDGGPTFFPPEQASKSPEAKRSQFASAGAFRKALKDEYGLATTADVNKALDAAGWGPLAQVGNLDEAFAAIKAHRSTEAT